MLVGFILGGIICGALLSMVASVALRRHWGDVEAAYSFLQRAWGVAFTVMVTVAIYVIWAWLKQPPPAC